jgi:hypothetical protein
MAEGNEIKAELDPRVRFAAERTLLAWIRTGLAMMGFGFVVARFGWFLRELALQQEGIRTTSPSCLRTAGPQTSENNQQLPFPTTLTQKNLQGRSAADSSNRPSSPSWTSSPPGVLTPSRVKSVRLPPPAVAVATRSQVGSTRVEGGPHLPGSPGRFLHLAAFPAIQLVMCWRSAR